MVLLRTSTIIGYHRHLFTIIATQTVLWRPLNLGLMSPFRSSSMIITIIYIPYDVWKYIYIYICILHRERERKRERDHQASASSTG